MANKSGALKKAIAQTKSSISGANGETFSNAGTFQNIGDTLSGLFGNDGGANAIENVGEGASQGAGGGIWGVVIGTVGGVTESIFDWKTSKVDQETANQQAKMSLYEKLLAGKGGKTNWMPIVVVGGVLLLGGIVVYFTLKGKK